MDNKKNIYIIVALIILVTGGAGFWYWSQKKVQEPVEPEPSGAVESAESLSESVPKIETNPGEKVPEVNPLDRANPFKYDNPLR